MKSTFSALIGLTILASVSSCKTANTATTTQQTLNNIALNGKVYSAVWQQNSGEFRALCYQAYNAGKARIDAEIQLSHTKPLAIITDIDETFLDNSPYAVTEAKKGKDFNPQTWTNWTSKAEARAYPGSLDFFNYAASKGITTFYITNRNLKDKPGTLKNLQDLGFPFADNDHVIVMTDTSDKETRRQAVLKDYDVILYMGDNLTDFSQIFYKKSQAERNQKVDALQAEFGKKFIVLPNSGYGDWESALPGYSNKLTPKEKDQVFLQNVKGY